MIRIQNNKNVYKWDNVLRFRKSINFTNLRVELLCVTNMKKTVDVSTAVCGLGN